MRVECIRSRRIADKEYEAGKRYELPKAQAEKYIAGGYFKKVLTGAAAQSAKKASAGE